MIFMKFRFKIGVSSLITILCIGFATPIVTVLETESYDNQQSMGEINDNTEELATIQLTDDDLIINGETYTPEKLLNLLDTAQEISPQNKSKRKKRFVAAPGIYFIPGIGQIALAATGAIILGGVAIGTGHWAYNTIKNWLNDPQNSASRTYGIPKRLLDSNGNVKVKDFNQRIRGSKAWREPKTGYIKEKDEIGHGGKKWKIKDKKGKQKASTDENGKILSD